MKRDQPNWIPFIIGGSFAEAIGLILVMLATTRSGTEQPPAAMLAGGIALLAVGGLLTTLGIIKMAAAKKGR